MNAKDKNERKDTLFVTEMKDQQLNLFLSYPHEHIIIWPFLSVITPVTNSYKSKKLNALNLVQALNSDLSFCDTVAWADDERFQGIKHEDCKVSRIDWNVFVRMCEHASTTVKVIKSYYTAESNNDCKSRSKRSCYPSEPVS